MTHTNVANIEAVEALAQRHFAPEHDRARQAVTSRFASANADIAACLLGGRAGEGAPAV